MSHKVTEDFICLALNPESGRYMVLGNYLTYGVVGAVLMDLSLSGKIVLEGHNIIPGRDVSLTGIPAYDRMMNNIIGSGKVRTLTKWIRKQGNKSAWYRKELQKYFVRQGILKVERKRFLGISYSLHYPARPGLRKNLINRYKEIIMYNRSPEEHEIMVLGLIFACKMHRLLSVGGPERRDMRKKLVEIIRDNKYASDINKAILETQSAITASIAASAAASAATSASH